MTERPGAPDAAPWRGLALGALSLAGAALLATPALAQTAPGARAAPAAAPGAAAAPPGPAVLRIALIVLADDERHDERRGERAYPGQPGGPPDAALAVALEEARFELDAARLQPRVERVALSDAAQLRPALARLEQAGTAAVMLDLPAAWLSALWTAGASLDTRMALMNIGAADDALRGAACHPALFHTLPSERMRADALAQWLTARRWSRVLVLHGEGPQDLARLATVQASIKRYGLQATAVRAFRLSADPRERDRANPALLTAPAQAGGDYDVVWVVDSGGEFGRSIAYRSALPRPLVGDAGLTAQAWASHFERFGAPQLSRRFAREARRAMTGHDWAAWMAMKAVAQAAASLPRPPGGEALRRSMSGPDFVLDGFKGTRIGFRPWDRQLRQPLLLGDGLGVVGSAPVDGILHPRNALDTLGADAPETACKAAS